MWPNDYQEEQDKLESDICKIAIAAFPNMNGRLARLGVTAWWEVQKSIILSETCSLKEIRRINGIKIFVKDLISDHIVSKSISTQILLMARTNIINLEIQLLIKELLPDL